MTKPRGFALVIVLWTLVLLSFVMTHMVTTGRTEARIAANFVANADAETQADGAVVETVFRMIDASDAHWEAGEGSYVLNMRKAAVAAGVLKAGDALPSIRQLANDLDLNSKTVAKAYKLLERDSVIEAKGYRGTYVHPEAKANCKVNLQDWSLRKLGETVQNLGSS